MHRITQRLPIIGAVLGATCLLAVCALIAIPFYQLCVPDPGPRPYPHVIVATSYDEGGGSMRYRTWTKHYTVQQPLVVVQRYYDQVLGGFCQREDPWTFTTRNNCGNYAQCREASCTSRGWLPPGQQFTADTIRRTQQSATITLYVVSATTTLVFHEERFVDGC